MTGAVVTNGNATTQTKSNESTPKKKKLKIQKLNEIITNSSSNPNNTINITNETNHFAIQKSNNIKINELIGQMQQHNNIIITQANQNLKSESIILIPSSSSSTTDFEIRMDSHHQNNQSNQFFDLISQQNGKGGQKNASLNRKSTGGADGNQKISDLENAAANGNNNQTGGGGQKQNQIKRKRVSHKNGVLLQNSAEADAELAKSNLINDENAVDNTESIRAACTVTSNHIGLAHGGSTSNGLNHNIINQPVVIINGRLGVATDSSLQTLEDHSSCSTLSQQDEEIKELLMKKNMDLNNKDTCISHDSSEKLKNMSKVGDSNSYSANSINPSSGGGGGKILADELKQLLQKEKQTTADLVMQLFKVSNIFQKGGISVEKKRIYL